MHPVSTVLFLLGYGLALPIIARLSAAVAQQHRLAIIGHQVGMTIAGVGWLLRGRVVFALVHLAWMVAVRIWFASRASA